MKLLLALACVTAATATDTFFTKTDKPKCHIENGKTYVHFSSDHPKHQHFICEKDAGLTTCTCQDHPNADTHATCKQIVHSGATLTIGSDSCPGASSASSSGAGSASSSGGGGLSDPFVPSYNGAPGVPAGCLMASGVLECNADHMDAFRNAGEGPDDWYVIKDTTHEITDEENDPWGYSGGSWQWTVKVDALEELGWQGTYGAVVGLIDTSITSTSPSSQASRNIFGVGMNGNLCSTQYSAAPQDNGRRGKCIADAPGTLHCGSPATLQNQCGLSKASPFVGKTLHISLRRDLANDEAANGPEGILSVGVDDAPPVDIYNEIPLNGRAYYPAIAIAGLNGSFSGDAKWTISENKFVS